jgi:site-specific DNA-methyltransferase (adenine-specific)
MAAMNKLRNQILCGDCVEILQGNAEPFADLVFADPPFNIGYTYDQYHDRKKSGKYLAWTRDWIGACVHVLKPHGSFYIAIGDEYAAQIKLMAENEFGLTLRNWIIWHYSFGQQTKSKFARAHTHILYFVKDAKNFVFNDEAVRVISDRQKKYNDKRANPAGKMPDDVWDEYPRICGTFRERTGFPCQMPESLLARIIRVSSNEGDWVLDPFSGSGTTATVAHKLKRYYTSIDVSSEYVGEAKRRIDESEGLPIEGEGNFEWTDHIDQELKWLYHENKIPTEQLESNAKLKTLFAQKLNLRLGQRKTYPSVGQVMKRLIQLRKRAKLGPLRGQPIMEYRSGKAEEPLWETGRKRKRGS